MGGRNMVEMHFNLFQGSKCNMFIWVGSTLNQVTITYDPHAHLLF